MGEIAVGILSAIIAGVVAWWGLERQLRIRTITEERAKWRDRIRELAMDLVAPGPLALDASVGLDGAELHANIRRRAAAVLRLSLNPYDTFDREIVALLQSLEQADVPDPHDVDRVLVRLQLLLKHDWERAKHETRWNAPLRHEGMRGGRMPESPTRPDYNRCMEWRDRHPIDLDRTLPRS